MAYSNVPVTEAVQIGPVEDIQKDNFQEFNGKILKLGCCELNGRLLPLLRLGIEAALTKDPAMFDDEVSVDEE